MCVLGSASGIFSLEVKTLKELISHNFKSFLVHSEQKPSYPIKFEQKGQEKGDGNVSKKNQSTFSVQLQKSK